jgi:hypothetical protein
VLPGPGARGKTCVLVQEWRGEELQTACRPSPAGTVGNLGTCLPRPCPPLSTQNVQSPCIWLHICQGGHAVNGVENGSSVHKWHQWPGVFATTLAAQAMCQISYVHSITQDSCLDWCVIQKSDSCAKAKVRGLWSVEMKTATIQHIQYQCIPPRGYFIKPHLHRS